MSDSTKIIPKMAFYAAEQAGLRNQYSEVPASKQLELMLSVENGRYEKDAVKAMLPERMTAMSFDGGKGEAHLTIKKTADFFVPGSGVENTTVSGMGVIPILVADTIMEGAYPNVCAREALNVRNMNSNVETVPFFTAKSYVPISAPGADAYDLMQNVGHFTLKAARHTLKASLGKELIKDAQPDIAASVLKEMGGSMELTINRECYSNIITKQSNTALTVGTAGTGGTTEMPAVMVAASTVDKAGFRADTCVAIPMFWGRMMGNLIPAYNVMAQQQVELSRKFNYGGINFHKMGSAMDTDVAAAATYPITYGTSGSYGAFVYEKNRIGMLGLREDMIAEEFDDVVKYLTVPVLTSRFNWGFATDENTSSITNAKAFVMLKSV